MDQVAGHVLGGYSDADAPLGDRRPAIGGQGAFAILGDDVQHAGRRGPYLLHVADGGHGADPPGRILVTGHDMAVAVDHACIPTRGQALPGDKGLHGFQIDGHHQVIGRFAVHHDQSIQVEHPVVADLTNVQTADPFAGPGHDLPVALEA